MHRIHLLLILLILCLVGTAHADPVQLNFSGGNGSPLVITDPQPLSFTVTSAINSISQPSEFTFTFQSVGEVIGNSQDIFSQQIPAGSNIRYTVNNSNNPFFGTPLMGMGQFPFGVATVNDLQIYSDGPSFTLHPGDTVQLRTGIIESESNIAAPPPASGLYNAILVDGGVQIANGIAVPEPRSLSLLALTSAALLRRRP